MRQVPASRYLLFFTLCLSAVSWDLYSKHIIFTQLGFPGRVGPWVKQFFGGWVTFRYYTSFNHGALWGIGQGQTWLFAGLSVVAVVGVLYWLFVVGVARSWWLTVSLALIMGGTLGNLWDRLALHGCVVKGEVQHAVRDFLLFTFGGWPWPVFNFADVFLVTGAMMLMLQSMQPEAGSAISSEPETANENEQLPPTATKIA